MAFLEDQSQGAPAQIPVKKVASDGSCDNDTALSIALKDARQDEKFLSEKMWALRWREVDALYQSPRPISLWEGSYVQEANTQSYLIAKHTDSIVPTVMKSIFFQDPFFLLRPNPGMAQEVTRQKTAVFSTLFRDMDFETECWDGWFYTVLFGTAIYKWGIKVTPKQRPEFKRRMKKQKITGKYFTAEYHTPDSKIIDVEDNEEDYWCPYIEHIPNEEVLVDCRLTKADIRKAKHVTHIRYMSGYELIEMCKEHEGEDGWVIPTEATIRSWFDEPREEPAAPPAPLSNMTATTILEHAREPYRAEQGDPLDNVLKVAEYTTTKRICLYVQDKYVLRNSKNQWGRINYFSSHWLRIPRSFWSLGIGHLVGQEQRVEQGVRNAALNLLAMAVNPPILRLETENQPSQNIRLRRGAMLTVRGVDDVRKGYSVMEMPRVPPDLWPVLASSKQTAEETTGADQRLAQGNTAGAGTSMGRTAAGALQLAAARSARIQGPVSRFVKNVMEPFIYLIDELVNEEMPEKQLIDILGDEMGSKYLKTFDTIKYLNGKLKFECLAAQHIAAKQGMAQILPLMVQMFENQQLLKQLNAMGYTVDVKELCAMFFEVSEWTNRADVIRKMTPQERAMMMQTIQAGANAQTTGKAALQAQAAGQQSDINSEKNDARASDIVLRHMLENAMQPEVLTGAAGGGYGEELGTGEGEAGY
jgi:hypothetical protein